MADNFGTKIVGPDEVALVMTEDATRVIVGNISGDKIKLREHEMLPNTFEVMGLALIFSSLPSFRSVCNIIGRDSGSGRSPDYCIEKAIRMMHTFTCTSDKTATALSDDIMRRYPDLEGLVKTINEDEIGETEGSS